MNRRIALFILFLISANLNAQSALINFYEFPGSSGQSMGKAWVAFANDATAMTWNPARLTKIERGHAMISGSYGNAGSGFNRFQADELLGWKIQQKDISEFKFAGLVWPYSDSWDNTHIGLGIVRHTNQFPNQKISLSVPQTIHWDWKERNDGHITSIMAAIGVDVYRALSLGITMDFIYGEEIFYSSFRQSGISPDTVITLITHQYTGTAFSFAVNLSDVEGFDFGLNVHFPHTVDRDRSINRSEIRFPFFFELGASGRVFQQLMMALQFSYRPWDRVDIKTGPNIEHYTPDALHTISMGFEYPLNYSDFNWRLRAGYRFKPILSNVGSNPAIYGHEFSIGSVYESKWYVMSAAISWETFQHSFRNYALDSTFTLSDVEQQWNRLTLSLDLGVKLVH